MRHRKRKIAVVIPKYGLVGGAERFVAEMTERIAQDDRYEVHVVANRWQSLSGSVAFHKAPIFSFPKFLTTTSFAWFVQRTVSRIGVDLIHAHDRICHAHIFTLHGIPHRQWVEEVRRKSFPSLYDRATWDVERRLIEDPACRYLLAVSELTREKYLQAYRLEPDRIRVIHPGVDVETFRRPDRRDCRRDVRGRFGIDESDTVVLFVSMNFDVKGLDALIRAMASARRLHPDRGLKLLVVGKGREEPYRKLARDLGIGGDVLFAGVMEKNLEKIYRACDIFSILSKFDTFGMTVLEAMAAGLPVLISDRVGAKDLVRSGINGFVIGETMDAEGVGSKIGLMMDREVRARMGAAARETSDGQTWERAAERVRAVYEALFQQWERRER